MSEEDFFNEDEWLAAGGAGEDADEKDDDAAVVTEVLKDVEIPADMPADERYRLLQNMYPELDYMADTLLELQPLLVTLQREAEGQDSRSLAVVKYRILGCYVASLAMYFATLTAPSRDADGEAKPLSPAELRDHEVMATLLECREAWKKVEPLQSTSQKAPLSPPDEEDMVSDLDNDDGQHAAAAAFGDLAAQPKKKTTTKRQAKADRKAKALEASLAELDNLVAATQQKKKKQAKSSSSATAIAQDDDENDSENNGNNSDFGEEEVLDARAAAEKAARKKSLRFYTSQIVQKANRRAGAGRDAGGDMDLPYRERLKDRQLRLNAEAEKRGLKLGKGAELGSGASDDEDDEAEQKKAAAAIREDEDEYYDMVAARTSRKKEDKAARKEALAAASVTDRIVETETVDADGKRKITYAIEKNKGLAPKRNKDNRNPRVKKRKMYADKQKKLKSMKAVYSGGEGKGGYGGELTGIKSGLIKSVKL
ncbi:Sas10 C-terminal domain-containing protein [Microdochium trichocladiopsis]|uniref:Sas10 C-terminal domain-containing protein n=1 Tax=Microdochium trichocladiopsis TaxID=1682393 RepID=A0A9P8YJ89_9PEZI|nr:Sas10 C-terminal domain-containing protein [Microdochium trichocladiopsis]KAH7041285.1 Sas10 C-terminal domain-containing protein [Microdochium trichocladiopsis]